MNWLNIETNILHAPEFIGSKPLARATWLCVSIWCAAQENGGRIAGARDWGSRQWQQTCGVTKPEIHAAPLLLTWEGDDLIVWRYPLGHQVEVHARREAGRIGGHRTAMLRAKQNGAAAPVEAASSRLEGDGAAGGKTLSSEGEAVESGRMPLLRAVAAAGTPVEAAGSGKQGGARSSESGRMPLLRAAAAAGTPTEIEVIAYGRSPQGSVPEEICRVWWNEHEARPRHVTGGYTDKSGLLVADWRAALRGFALRWRNYESQRAAGRNGTVTAPRLRKMKRV